MKTILLLAAVVLFGSNAFAQPATVDASKIKVITAADALVIEKFKTTKGLMVVSNEPGNKFSFEIRGKKITSLPGASLRFSVDGKYLEVIQHDKAQFVSAADTKEKLTELEILDRQQKWYSARIETNLGTRLQVETVPLKIMMDKDVLKWSFPMPPEAGYKHLKRQAYLSIVQGDRIFTLNSAWTTEIVEYKEISQLLWKTMTSLDLVRAIENENKSKN